MEVIRYITQQNLLNRLKSQRNESIALLAGKIANDFNNLLASIIGNVSLIQMSDTLDAELMENAGEIEEAALRAKTLANQLLTFSKGGSPVKKVQPIDLILSNSLSLAMSGSRTKLNLHSTETLPWVNVDEGQLSQVFKNLTTNSLHAMRDSGTLDIFLTSKMIGNADNIPLDTGNYLKISFRDTGSGIAQQQQHLIFQPYFTTKTHGIGLGLATSYSIIKKHGGIMTFESEKSKGTTFYIYLPTVPQPLPEIEPSNTLDLIKNEQILLLEDEPIVYKMLQKILIKMGFSVDITEDGADTITKYKMKYEDKQPYALVILDLTIIGGMGGEKTVKEIRKINPNVKAIVSSGYSNDDVLANFEDYGFCDILTKPYSLAELQNKILKVLNSR